MSVIERLSLYILGVLIIIERLSSSWRVFYLRSLYLRCLLFEVPLI